MLRTRIGLAPDTRLVSHAKARRLGLVTKLLSLLAVIGAVFLGSSSAIAAAADPDEILNKLQILEEEIRLADDGLKLCHNDCNLNHLKDVLTCGEISLRGYEELWYVPWWTVDNTLTLLALKHEKCELDAKSAQLTCSSVCLTIYNARLREAQINKAFPHEL